MSKIAHTPGPWFIVTPTQGFEICTVHGVERQPTEDGLGQTWVYIRPESLVRDGEWTWPDEAECTANAHLIAAAPDLYAALEEGRRAIGDHFAPNDCYATGPLTGDHYRDLVECPACSFIAMYDAAIAKARGEA